MKQQSYFNNLFGWLIIPIISFLGIKFKVVLFGLDGDARQRLIASFFLNVDFSMFMAIGFAGLINELSVIKREAKRQKGELTSSNKPPVNAQFLLFLFLPKSQRYRFVDDLNEEFKEIRKRIGRNRAVFWYWWQVIASIWPIFIAWLKRLNALKPLFEFIVRQFSK
jgi:hypothetical protein